MTTIQGLEEQLAKYQNNKTRKREIQCRSALQPIDNEQTLQHQQHNPKRAKISARQNVPSKIPVKANAKPSLAEIQTKKEPARQQEKVVKEVESDNLQEYLQCLEIVKKQPVKPPVKKQLKKKDHVVDLEYHSEYLRDIWSYLLNMEKKVQWPKPNYMSRQVYLDNSMRCILVDWLVSVAEEYDLSEQTIHLSVNYIDRFLSQMSVVKEKFQLLGSAAMMLAGKVEEIYPPDSNEWANLSGNSYTSQQVRWMEMLLLKVLKFDLQPPTMLAFIQHMCVEHKMDKETMYLAMYISELILLEGEDYLYYTPSKLAASAVALSRMLLSKKKPWPRVLETSYGYTLQQLSPIVQWQKRTFSDSPTKPQQAIRNKYQSSKYHKVALIKPKALNMDEE